MVARVRDGHGACTRRGRARDGDELSDSTLRIRDEERQTSPTRPTARRCALIDAPPRRARRARRRAAASTRCSSATTIDAIMAGVRAGDARRSRRPAPGRGVRAPDGPPGTSSASRSGPLAQALDSAADARPDRPHRRSRRGDRRRARPLPRRASACPWPTARRSSEQGVEAVLLDVGEDHVELLAPLGPDTPVGKFLAKQRPRAAPRRLPGGGHRRRRSSALREAGTAADRRDAARRASAARASPSCTRRATGGVLTEIVQPRGEDH